MLPLLFPSDPRLLAALPGNIIHLEDAEMTSMESLRSDSGKSSKHTNTFAWRSRDRKVREIGIEILQWVDGVRSASRWGNSLGHDIEAGNEEDHSTEETEGDKLTVRINTHITPLTRKPSGRAKGRLSISETTPINGSFDKSLE